MKRLIFSGIWLIVFSTVLYAETMYVKEVKITLRSEQELSGGNIIAYLQTGQELEVVKTEKNWAFVRVPGGKEGWVLSQYLVPDKPRVVSVEFAQKDCEKLLVQTDTLNEENKRLKEDNKRLAANIAERDKKITELTATNETFKKESADLAKAKPIIASNPVQSDSEKKDVESLKVQLSEMKKTDMIKWFLAGAGVLIIGFIMGSLAKGRRKSYY